jgi:hypothetical protein
MKSARILSVSFLIGVSTVVAAGEIPVGEGPYPPEPKSVSTTSRAQVVGELREAQRLGLISVGEADSNVVALQPASVKTRAQVIAELREAQRLGLVNVGGEGDTPVATAAQEQLIVEAGVRALEQPRVAAR